MASNETAESYDYFNPFMAAKIVTKDNEVYPLWIGATAETVGFDIKTLTEGSTLKSLSFLTEMQVEMDLSFIPRITLTLSPPFDDGIKLIDTKLLEIGDNLVQVQFGYVGGPDGKPVFREFEGMITQPPAVSITPGFISITITAQGLNGALNLGTTEGGETFKNLSRELIMKEIATRYGCEIFIDDDTLKDPTSGPLLTKDIVTKSQLWKTALFFLQQLANEARCYLLFGTKGTANKKQPIRVVSRTALLVKQQPKFILSMFHYKSSDFLGQTVYPILSLDSVPTQLFLLGVQQIVLEEIDARTKQTVNLPVTAKEANVGQTAPGPIDVKGRDGTVLPKAEKRSVVQRIPGDPANKSALQQANQAFDTFMLATTLELELETIGMPTVEPGHLVMLRGLGKKLDRAYVVFGVRHTLGSSGFTTSLTLKSNTSTTITQLMTASGLGNQNKLEPKTAGGKDVSATKGQGK
jgi:hypothetical protein